ncbi:MAG: flagellar protein export ATPase FliI [Nitrospirota bacterium]
MINSSLCIGKYMEMLDEIEPIKQHGKVTQLIGLVIEGHGAACSVGDVCEIYPLVGGKPIDVEVVGFRDEKILMMPLGEIRGIGPGSKIATKQYKTSIKVGDSLLGRVIDGMGNPIDWKGLPELDMSYPIYPFPLNPLCRKRIKDPLDMGIKAINGLLTIGKGQRIGIFAGSGVGKSILLGMLARNVASDVNVIALIGERGREVLEFIEKDLKEEGLRRTVVVTATSDQPPLVRARGAYIATTIAEYFRDKGQDVLLMMDSITRFAMAQREIGLAIGEAPTTKGYTPSVFAQLPKLLERAGTSNRGSITGIYTVLVEGDDFDDPISDAVRAILDGHIMLSRDLAAQNHYPAIDILNSTSRVMIDVVTEEHINNTRKFLNILATYKKSEDMINIGAYKEGSSPKIDNAIEMIDRINGYLKQGINEKIDFNNSLTQLSQLFS